jgi:tRNA threonylcarbamoyladenosine biosynthesis protein TsaE
MNTKFFDSASAAQTKELAREMAASLPAGTVLLLSGELGAGKTCFVTGLAEGLKSKMEVSSPTFTLINEYKDGRLPLYHIDLYRLEGQHAIEGLGLDEYFDGTGISVVEWPERLESLKPEGAWELHFEYQGETGRRIRVQEP